MSLSFTFFGDPLDDVAVSAPHIATDVDDFLRTSPPCSPRFAAPVFHACGLQSSLRRDVFANRLADRDVDVHS
jgi:hypothetical protein